MILSIYYKFIKIIKKWFFIRKVIIKQIEFNLITKINSKVTLNL